MLRLRCYLCVRRAGGSELQTACCRGDAPPPGPALRWAGGRMRTGPVGPSAGLRMAASGGGEPCEHRHWGHGRSSLWGCEALVESEP
eukprot:8529478-Pyramimonas_sp.AAC.1